MQGPLEEGWVREPHVEGRGESPALPGSYKRVEEETWDKVMAFWSPLQQNLIAHSCLFFTLK